MGVFKSYDLYTSLAVITQIESFNVREAESLKVTF